MEEILASIRRIIEDSDQGAPPIEQPVAAAVQTTHAEDVDAFRAELEDTDQPVAETAIPFQPEASTPSVARIHPLRSEQPASSEPQDDFDGLLPEIVAPSPVLADEEPAAPLGEQSGADTLEPAAGQPVEAKGSLISGATERQVVAAFGELSDAFAASRRRSFDEMAEEMLRPMLQDWLDNNLPGLVEKLVREEIERVARGGKA